MSFAMLIMLQIAVIGAVVGLLGLFAYDDACTNQQRDEEELAEDSDDAMLA